MAKRQPDGKLVFKIIDALDAPRQGRLLKLRTLEGTPTVEAVKGAVMRAVSPGGDEERLVRITKFSLVGGKPSDERIARTGRLDVIAAPAEGEEGSLDDIVLTWKLEGPVAG